jgi:hypothetical protein
MGVVAFTAHHVIATAAPDDWVRAQVPADERLAPMSPRFLAALGTKLGLRDDGIDVLLAAEGLPGRGLLREITDEQHPRIAPAAARRDGVRAFTDPSGLATIILGRGFALRGRSWRFVASPRPTKCCSPRSRQGTRPRCARSSRRAFALLGAKRCSSLANDLRPAAAIRSRC